MAISEALFLLRPPIVFTKEEKEKLMKENLGGISLTMGGKKKVNRGVGRENEK